MDRIVPKVRTLSSYRRRSADIEVTPVKLGEIAELHDFITEALGPGVASVKKVQEVHAKQGFSVWRVRDRYGRTSGVFALLYLNQAGFEAVNDDRFDTQSPALEHLAENPSDVVAIYAWCFVLRGKAKAAILKVATWLDLCGWNECPIFTNPVTPAGSRLARALGFHPLEASGARGLHAVF